MYMNLMSINLPYNIPLTIRFLKVVQLLVITFFLIFTYTYILKTNYPHKIDTLKIHGFFFVKEFVCFVIYKSILTKKYCCNAPVMKRVILCNSRTKLYFEQGFIPIILDCKNSVNIKLTRNDTKIFINSKFVLFYI